MKRNIILMLCLIFVLGGCSSIIGSAPISDQTARIIEREKKQVPPADFIPKSISIVSIGDSLTQGVGDTNELGGYIPYLQTRIEMNKAIKDTQFYNFGINGNRTDQLLKRLKQKNIKEAIEHADLVIITIGGNDVMQVFKENLLGLKLNKFATAEKGYSKRLKEIIETVSSYNSETDIVLMGIYNPFIKWFSDIKEVGVIVDNWNQASADVIAEFDQASFVPVADIFENNEESLLYTDYFHPNNRGYELIAKRIYSYLVELNKPKNLLE